jgi:hypothetical protein
MELTRAEAPHQALAGLARLRHGQDVQGCLHEKLVKRGFGDVTGSPGLECRHGNLFTSFSRHQNDRDLRETVYYDCDQSQAVELGHHQVGDHQVGPLRLDKSQRLPPIGSELNCQPRHFAKHAADQPAVDRRIVDDKDDGHGSLFGVQGSGVQGLGFRQGTLTFEPTSPTPRGA